MEDRYLFKAKRADNGEWVQGNLIQSCDATDGWEAIIIPAKNSNMFTKHIKRGYGNLGFENWYRVDPSTICQCTGLRDKNGELIWENDIVKDLFSLHHCSCISPSVLSRPRMSYHANATSARPIMPNTIRAVYTTVVMLVILHHSLALIFKVFSIFLKLSCTSAICK
jgi:hypothetical protein